MKQQVHQLIEIKRRREQSLRSEITQLHRERALLQQTELSLQQERVSVRLAWRKLTQQEGHFNSRALDRLRRDLSELETNVNKIELRLRELSIQQKKLTGLIGENEKRLRTVLREQEKLKFIMEAE